MTDDLIQVFDAEIFLPILRAKFSSFTEQDARHPTPDTRWGEDARREERAKETQGQTRAFPEPGGLGLMRTCQTTSPLGVLAVPNSRLSIRSIRSLCLQPTAH